MLKRKKVDLARRRYYIVIMNILHEGRSKNRIFAASHE